MTRSDHPARRPAIITGASSGIGKATAVELVARGFPVAVGARRVDKLEKLVDKIRGDGGEAVCFALDVTDQESVESFVAQAVEALGDIEVLVSGAGDMFPGKVHEIGTDAFLDQIQIHLIGAHRMANAVLPGMVSRQRGDVIFIGSDVALEPRVQMGAYGAAKAGLVAMVKNLRMELEGSGVRASIVHPGQTSTHIGHQLTPEQLEPMLLDWAAWGHTRHGGFLQASDIARVVAFVAGARPGSSVVAVEMQPEAPLAAAAVGAGG
jgi:NADP-dependent 3-hydroxy acid dehydrogenase YdfG